jgi:DNA-directed RNA polymerase subunit H (RpoH/RPB5)
MEWRFRSLKLVKRMDDRAMKTVKEMLIDRGIKGDLLDIVTPAMDETHMYNFGGILVIYSTKNRVNSIAPFVEFAKENGFNSGVIIISETPLSEKVFASLVNHNVNRENHLVQVFLLAHLYFNYSKHRFVPKHRLLDDKEKSDLAKKFPILMNLPHIESQDPQAKYWGARPGDVMEIMGMCEVSGENKHWRICVAETTNG